MPPVTLALLFANGAIFLLQLALPGLPYAFGLWPVGSWRVNGVRVGFEFWQLLTYAFLHGGMLHLGFNMFALWMFGGPIERVFGGPRYLLYYFVCVVSAGITQLAVSTLGGMVYVTIGASGGVFGLLLAYGMYFPHTRIMLLFPPIPMPARVFVIVFALIELVLGVTGSSEGIAHFAHLGGMAGGFVMIRYWRSGGTMRGPL